MATPEKWEAGFRAAVRAGRVGWTVNNKGGRIQLKVRQPDQPQQTKCLPLPWDSTSLDAALQLIGRIYKLVEGNHETLQRAAEICLGVSDTMAPARSWPAIAESLRDALQTGRNEILDKTWHTNYEPYVQEALRLLSSSSPPRNLSCRDGGIGSSERKRRPSAA